MEAVFPLPDIPKTASGTAKKRAWVAHMHVIPLNCRPPITLGGARICFLQLNYRTNLPRHRQPFGPHSRLVRQSKGRTSHSRALLAGRLAARKIETIPTLGRKPWTDCRKCLHAHHHLPTLHCSSSARSPGFQKSILAQHGSGSEAHIYRTNIPENDTVVSAPKVRYVPAFVPPRRLCGNRPLT